MKCESCGFEVIGQIYAAIFSKIQRCIKTKKTVFRKSFIKNVLFYLSAFTADLQYDHSGSLTVPYKKLVKS